MIFSSFKLGNAIKTASFETPLRLAHFQKSCLFATNPARRACLSTQSSINWLALNLGRPISSAFRQRVSEQRGIGESTHSLEIALANCPNMGKRHIDGRTGLPRFSLDATERDDFLALGDEFFSDEVNVEGFIEAGEKALEHVLKADEMAAADGHPFRHIVNNMRRLETSQ
jgi:hypothetical protein